jgi:hypothetical protein
LSPLVSKGVMLADRGDVAASKVFTIHIPYSSKA